MPYLHIKIDCFHTDYLQMLSNKICKKSEVEYLKMNMVMHIVWPEFLTIF